jgi:hypothetical protein
MNAGGWTMLVITWSVIIGLLCFCFYRVLSRKKIN